MNGSRIESPLVQAERGQLRPKIISLYEQFFSPPYDKSFSQGFWVELLLLPCNQNALRTVIANLSPDDMLANQLRTQEFFRQCVLKLANWRQLPEAQTESYLNVRFEVLPGPIYNINIQYQTLDVLVQVSLNKKYTNFSSDAIAILAGIQNCDEIFPKYMDVLEAMIREAPSPRLQLLALHTAISSLCSCYRTSLSTYFTQKDFFPAIMQFIEADNRLEIISRAFLFLGVLASFNKVEGHNPYQLRLADSVNEKAMRNGIRSGSINFSACIDVYLKETGGAGQDKQSLGVNYSGIWAYLDVRRVFSSSVSSNGNGNLANTRLARLPPCSVAILITFYEFSRVNKVFARRFIDSCQNQVENDKENGANGSTQATNNNNNNNGNDIWPHIPFVEFLTLSSFLLQYNHVSHRHALYARLSLLIFGILLQDHALARRLCSPDNKVANIPLCQQRTPRLPTVSRPRLPIEGLLDCVIGSLDHNLRRKNLDVDMYTLSLRLIVLGLNFFKSAKFRLSYHWSEVWRSTLNVIKYITTNGQELISTFGLEKLEPMAQQACMVLASALLSADAFLAETSSYDDLFYKLLASQDILSKFKIVFPSAGDSQAMSILSTTLDHCGNLINAKKQEIAQRAKINDLHKIQLTTDQVYNVLSSGYDTLILPSMNPATPPANSLNHNQDRNFFKKLVNVVINDTQTLESNATI